MTSLATPPHVSERLREAYWCPRHGRQIGLTSLSQPAVTIAHHVDKSDKMHAMSSTIILQTKDKVVVLPVGHIIESLVVKVLDVAELRPRRGVLGPHLRPLGAVHERIIDRGSGLARCLSSLAILDVEVLQVHGLQDDRSDEDTQEDKVSGKTGVVVRLLLVEVQLGTDNVADGETDVQASGRGGLLGVASGVGEAADEPWPSGG